MTDDARPARRHFAGSIHDLNQRLARAGLLCREMIGRAAEALERQDVLQGDEVIRLDSEVDAAAQEVQQRAISLLATQQPVAGDLRALALLLRAVLHLERIADYAVDMARYARALRPFRPVPVEPALVRMAEKVGLMVEHTLDAFVERDLAAIERLCGPEEQAVDELEQAVLHASLARLRSGDVAPEVAVYQVLAARCLERAGDHCTDIAEWIRYSESGIYEELA